LFSAKGLDPKALGLDGYFHEDGSGLEKPDLMDGKSCLGGKSVIQLDSFNCPSGSVKHHRGMIFRPNHGIFPVPFGCSGKRFTKG
jgi:hypothetical protein